MREPVGTPVHVWIVGAISVIWNAFGAFDYVMTQAGSDAYMAQLTDAQRDYLESFPWLVNGAWGIAVAGAVAGSLLLLVRSRFAVSAFAVSLGGMLVTTIYQYGVSTMPADMQGTSRLAFILVIWAVAIALLWYAVRMRGKGVLR